MKTNCKGGLEITASTPKECVLLGLDGINDVFANCRHVDVCSKSFVAYSACKYEAIPGGSILSGSGNSGQSERGNK